jgi:hypothetical protein
MRTLLENWDDECPAKFVKPKQLQQAESFPCKGDVFELGIPKVFSNVPNLCLTRAGVCKCQRSVPVRNQAICHIYIRIDVVAPQIKGSSFSTIAPKLLEQIGRPRFEC